MSQEKSKELVITRTFDAPRDLVWKANSEKDRLAKWWGPKGAKLTVAKLDFRPGGTFLYGMEAPDGKMMWGKFVYREIVPLEKIVFVVSFCDEHGTPTRNPFMPKWALETLNTVTFTEENGKTTIRISGGPINATDEERKLFEDNFGGMEQGFKGTYDQLEEYLATSKG